MASVYLHNHPDFHDLLRIIEDEEGVLAGLVEKVGEISKTLRD
jgi:hypothetical protein